MDRFWRLPWHSLIFGAYPILALMEANLQEAPLVDGVRALIFGLVLALVLVFTFTALTKDLRRAGLLSTLILISFFSYGHVYTGLKALGDFALVIARHRFLLPFWLLITLVVLWLAWRAKSAPSTSNIVLNLVAALLLVYPLYQISAFITRNWINSFSEPEYTVQAPADSESPDIYYIIADAYTREDVLREFYGFDNSEFLDQLRESGFYVADCSLSNYPWTRLSLTSSLNMDYVENLGITVHDQDEGAWRRIRNSEVRKKMAAEGYKIVSLQTGFYWTEWPDADLYLSQKDAGFHLKGFEALMLQTTLWRAPSDLLSGTEGNASPSIQGGTLQERYNITQYALDQLDELPNIEGPKFVFAHLVIPHDPFVFDAQGNFTSEPGSVTEAYDAQVTYLNQRLISAFKVILSQSKGNVIIILQGDHGGPGTVGTFDRMKILNAYYMPEARARLYPSVTPVNSFRIVFDTYFGTNLGLLEDLSYHSTTKDFSDVTLTIDDNPACIK